ncbi:MAG TPA: hypothetical protein PKY59_05140 [Pyrinomonadaceae bacterium]|nr:hypothetical protein [Pyrinomonadaceae bacterium]
MISKLFSFLLQFILMLLVIQTVSFAFVQNGKVKFDEVFTLRKGETAETEDAQLKIRLLSVGRSIAESGEIEYVELQVKTRRSERNIVISEKGNRERKVGIYTIELVDAESFGDTNCRLKVSRKK